MKLSKQQIQQQREMIDGLYELVKDAPASERKDSAMAYCEGCIAACDLSLKILNGKKVEAQPAVEEKPKRKRKKKEEPVVETPVVEETPEEDDLDDLL